MTDAATPVELTTAKDEAADCMACSHALDDHDATALRFCNATVERALTRGCICRPDAG